LKKRSAASTTEPLEGYVFLVEESLGKGVAETLSQNGFRVVHQGQEIPTGITDLDLFAIAMEKGYVLLSKDLRTRYRPSEKAGIILNELAVFQLAKGTMTGPQMCAAFIAAKPVIRRCLKRMRRPFIVRLSQEGKVTVTYSRDELTKGLKEDEIR